MCEQETEAGTKNHYVALTVPYTVALGPGTCEKQAKLFLCTLFGIIHWPIAAGAPLSWPEGTTQAFIHLCMKHLPGLSSLQVDHEQQYTGTGYSLDCVLWTGCRQKPTWAEEGRICTAQPAPPGTYVMRVPTSCFPFLAPAPSSLPSGDIYSVPGVVQGNWGIQW